MPDLMELFDDLELSVASMNSGAGEWPSKLYDVIVIDPPWEIEKVASKLLHVGRNQKKELDYSVMSLADITNLKIKDISMPNSVCFLWTIQKYLRDSFSILESWGFKPTVTMTWNKCKGLSLFGIGYINEFILFGYRGKLEMFPTRKVMPSVLTYSSTGHSIKPQEFYDYAEAFGEERIDIFARKPRSGWDIWGNEV